METQPLPDRIFEQYGIRTDLALEAHQVIVQREGPPEIPGVQVETRRTAHSVVSRVSITNQAGAQAMGKVPGNYVTIETKGLRERDPEAERDAAQCLTEELERMLQMHGIGPGAVILVVGLGNWNATPDAVGPRTVEQVVITRRVGQPLSAEQQQLLRQVCAIAPGVLGITGIETADIVRGVVAQVRPQLVIAVDALAAREVERLGTTIQLADVGVNPGSGVGNKRAGLTQKTLGVPVLALGVPTVIYATTIVNDALQALATAAGTGRAAQALPSPSPAPAPPLGKAPGPSLAAGAVPADGMLLSAGLRPNPSAGLSFAHLDNPALRQATIQRVLGPSMGTLVVTPKEVDVLVDNMAHVLAAALNAAMHPGVSLEEAWQYTQ